MPAQRSRTLTRPASTDEHEKGEHWDQQAACKDADPTLFFDPSDREPAGVRRDRIADALSYCDRCPVVAECRADAIATGDNWGIRGGVTSDQLKDIQRARRGLRRSA